MRWVVCLWLCGCLLQAEQSAKAWFEQAAQALKGGDYPAAERGFQAVLKLEPQNVGALGNLGILYARTNRPDLAIATYRRALKIVPNDPVILLNLGLVHLKQEAHGRALPYFERVLKLDPRNQQARQLAAICRLYSGQLGPAIQELEALRADHPGDDQLLFLLAFAYLKNRQPDTAKQVMTRMFDVAGPVKAQFLLGRASYEAALFAAAEESFLEVAKLDPAYPGLHIELGKVYISQRRTEDAIREMQTVLGQNANDQDANYLLGGLLVQETRYEEALPYLEKALKLKPDSWPAYFYLGKAKLRLGETARAIGLLERSAELNPDEPSIYYQLGRALQASGRKEEAGRAFRRVQELRGTGLKEGQVAGTVAGSASER